MSPEFGPGSGIWVHPTYPIKNGDYVVVTQGGRGWLLRPIFQRKERRVEYFK